MLFKYKTVDSSGKESEGTIDALNSDLAISSLQSRGLVVSSVKEMAQTDGMSGNRPISFFDRVSNKEVVILSRQVAVLFGAHISALRIFRMLSTESPNPIIRRSLVTVTDDLQAGSSISNALSKHPKIFSSFYVNMVKSGEETGGLSETFKYLADYLERNYEISSKANNAFIYPAFVIFTMIVVMVMMLTMVIPNISAILTESGGSIPLPTKMIIGLSNFFINYGVFLLVAIIIGGFFLFKFVKTEKGKLSVATFKLETPYVGTLYKDLYMARVLDNLGTMLAGGIPIVKAIEITSAVVDNEIYAGILKDVSNAVGTGSSLSNALAGKGEIPGIVVQMVKIGEETGELDSILKTLAKFYNAEVINAVDNLVSMIEPAMVIILGLGVAFLLVAIMVPIYNISSSI